MYAHRAPYRILFLMPNDFAQLKALSTKKIFEPLDFGKFHPDFKGKTWQVWINPPKTIIEAQTEIVTYPDSNEPVIDEVSGLPKKRDKVAPKCKIQTLVGVLMQITPDEMDEFFDFENHDGALLRWVAESVMDMFAAHYNLEEKKLTS